MFCPTCGEMAFIRDGKAGLHYEQVESSLNQGWKWYQEDKPDIGNGKYDHKGNYKSEAKSDDEEPEKPKGTALLRKKDTDFERDYKEWQKLGENVPQYNETELGKQPEIEGVKYAQCKNYLCNFHGPAAKVKKDGKEIDFDDLTSKHDVETREYEVIKDSDKMQGILTKDTYMCPKCDCIEVYAYLEQTRSSDEPETRMLTCKECGNGWREY